MLTLALSSPTHGLAEDAALARATREGSKRAAGELYDRHAPLVRRILARTLGPWQDVDDHVQETFLAFFRELRGLRDDTAARAFLVSIAVRIARGELRRRRVRRILRFAPPEEIVEVAGAGEGVDLEGREAMRSLFRLLDELDTSARLAFSLRYLEEMELAEVAEAVGESLATVKRRLARVLPVVKARILRDPSLVACLEARSGVRS
jgi:RNA polymerase sigma-70 factor (ECF subfamily)